MSSQVAVAGLELATSYYNIRGANSNHCTTTTRQNYLSHYKSDLGHWRSAQSNLNVISATTHVILAIDEVITTTLNVISAATKVTLATEEVITATSKVISASTKVILGTTDVITATLKII